MSDFETIAYAVENQVATISLNRPKAMNAVSQKMRHELKAVIDAAEADEAVRVVVIRAEGRGFTSGTDLTEGLAGFDTIDDQIQIEYKPLFEGIANSNKPYIAAIHGACAGVGASLALTCDLAVMSEDAFLYVPFAGLSLVPDGGMSHYLVSAMGYKRAYQTYIESGRIVASECEKYGIVNKVVAADSLQAEVQGWAEKLAKGAPLAQKLGKQIMRQAHESSFFDIFNLESKLQVTCTTSEDYQEGIDSFFQKRAPEFKGK